MMNVEARIPEDVPPEMLPTPLVESDVMLDPWVELPEPTEGIVTVSRLGEPDLPDALVVQPRTPEESSLWDW